MRQGVGAQQQRPQIPTPPVDPENVEFVIFVCNPKLPQWIPVSIVKGSRPTNLLVGVMDTEWGKKLFGKTLVRSIAQPIWKDRRKVEPKLKQQAPQLKFATKLLWAFKLRDRTKPNAWHEAVDLTILPEEGTLEPSIGEKVVDWFDGVRGKKKTPA